MCAVVPTNFECHVLYGSPHQCLHIGEEAMSPVIQPSQFAVYSCSV